MRANETIVLVYLIYLLIAAWLQRLPRATRVTVTVITTIDAAAIWWLTRQSGAWMFVRDWQPVLQILVGYWLSGLFFQAPMLRVEAFLSAGDRWIFERLGLNVLVARSPRILLELLELAYLSVYFVLPLGFAVASVVDHAVDTSRYWSIVTLAELACYGVLPWIQTRPPRALDDQMTIAGRRLIVRHLNDAVLQRGSIQVNTFPSGHAAGAFATALAVAHVSPVAAWAFVFVACSIVIGSIVGRYHYAADSLAGVIVAIIAWLLVR